jgi:hypothetical protein
MRARASLEAEESVRATDHKSQKTRLESWEIPQLAMLELSLLGTVFLIVGLALWMGADSDDDDRSGGLRQPVLVPIPVRQQYRR